MGSIGIMQTLSSGGGGGGGEGVICGAGDKAEAGSCHVIAVAWHEHFAADDADNALALLWVPVPVPKRNAQARDIRGFVRMEDRRG